MDLRSQSAAARQSRGTRVEQAQDCCRLAKQLEKAGEYGAACEALSEFWPEREGPPNVEGLDQATAAEVLLRVGALAGWLGSARQVGGSQETAKNLITRSVEIFEQLEQSERVAEAHADLALCYWREGLFDEARINLTKALSCVADQNSDLKAIILIRAGIVEMGARRLDEALRILNDSAPLVDMSTDYAMKGTFHNNLALVFKNLSVAENRNDYADRALIEYTAASFHFEQAGHTRHYASVENNLGFLFSTISKFTEAHAHLDQSRRLFLSLGDQGHVAQVDDTRAKVLLAEGRNAEAAKIAGTAVTALDNGDECSLLAEALITHGTALSRTGQHVHARATLQRAIGVAETCDDLETAGRARLTMIEELAPSIPPAELQVISGEAMDLLAKSQDPATRERLLSCARQVAKALLDHATETLRKRIEAKQEKVDWKGFSFDDEVEKYQRAIILLALKDSDGSVTRAAKLLGFKHHNTLIALLKGQHLALNNASTPARRRQQRDIKEKQPATASAKLTILYVEDHQPIANLVRDMLLENGMQVDTCNNGDGALELLKSDVRYDAIILDYKLPGVDGLELTRRLRKMAHYRRTPIIMLSGSDVEAEAWGAGVDAFLRKPEDIEAVPAAVARVLQSKLGKD
jgi:CheY-like chemotaxis protein